MTKNRASKRAARDRASVTGERYVVARRSVSNATPDRAADPAAPLRPAGRFGRTLHEWTHRVPGVPPHVESPNSRDRNPNALRNRVHTSPGRINPGLRHPRREPRILRGWQNWIASKVSRS